MIKFENTEVMNFEGAIRGMRNPFNSWDKSDSGKKFIPANSNEGYGERDFDGYRSFIGPCDLALMRRLIRGGSDHRKFMRQIFVSVDITAPLYWWKEFDTYKVATVSNSCSTMHKIHDKEFTLDDFSYENMTDRGQEVLLDIIYFLNEARDRFIRLKDKCFWWDMIQLLPSSYNQRRTITLNYETLYNIYGSRRNHKLDEWSVGFIDWIKSLPYANVLIIDRS